MEPELSEGAERPVEPLRFAPSPSPGWTWPLSSGPWPGRQRSEPRWRSAVSLDSGPVASRRSGLRRLPIPIRFPEVWAETLPRSLDPVRGPLRSGDRPLPWIREPDRFAL